MQREMQHNSIVSFAKFSMSCQLGAACDGEFKITSSCPPTLIDIFVVAILGTSFIVDHIVVALPPIKFCVL
jgi:hypothetical protein